MTDLPSSWITAEIAELVEPQENGKPFQQGWSPQCESRPADEGEWGVVKTTAIQHGEFWPHENKALPTKLDARPQIEIMPGDVLMTCAGPRNRCGVACLVDKTRPRLMMSGKMYRFRPHPEVLDARYLSHFIRLHDTQLRIDAMKTGINDSGLNLTHGRFGQLRVIVPPINEQRRIVEKIEAMFDEIDAAVQSLQTARTTLGLYRQSLLKSAFEGRLTADWRAQNADKLEAPETLLTRIQKERDTRYKAALDTWQDALAAWRAGGEKGKKPAKPRKAKDKAALTKDQIAELPLLPAEWVWVELGHLTWSVKDGPHFSPKYTEHGIPFISGGNIRPSGIDFDTAKYISPELHEELSQRCKPELGDVLYTKGGTTGIARVNTYDFDFNVWVHVAVLKITETTLPFYLQNALNSPFCHSQAQKLTHGVGNQDLGLTRMVNIRLPLCSPAEQAEIVRRLDARLEAADALEAEIDAALTRADALRQSILKKAFSGQLVAQDPNDEPASALLERIKAERAMVPRAKKRKTAHA